MASTELDEFILNFDVNHLNVEDTTQTTDQKYDKLRKNACWLKSKIISTDFIIQKYQIRKHDYEQAVKAHLAVKEELKDSCINYKNVSDKCVFLENENKRLLDNLEILKGRVVEIETKYEALTSHSNQLQMLIKQLEIEKDALKVEKELEKFNNKDTSEELIMLQKEKNVMLNDLKSLKDVILGKKKTSKKYIRLLKKYVKDIPKEPNISCMSEESEEEIDSYYLTHCQRKYNKTHNVADKDFTSSAEQNDVDNYSDGEISVDTGRGSSCTNSHDKFLNSPDYVPTENIIKIPPKHVKQINVANSPITICSLRSVATSPIIFDHTAALFEEHYDDYPSCFEGSEYINDISLSEEINVLVEQEKMADADPGPISNISKFIDMESSPVLNSDCINLKESVTKFSNKSLFMDPDEYNEFEKDTIIERDTPKCLGKKNDAVVIKKKFKDACTSPVPISFDSQKLMNKMSKHIVEHNECVCSNKNSEYESRISRRTCEKSTCTDPIFMSEKKSYVNVCTSPIFKPLYCSKYIDVGINTDNSMDNGIRVSRDCEKSTNTVTLTQSTSTDSEKEILSRKSNESENSLFINQEELNVVDDQISRCLNKKSLSKCRKTNLIEKSMSQEKVCLENNSSKNLHFESTSDAEVQTILNVMRLRHDLISPISQSPPDSSQYLRLLPEMNCMLTKILSTVTNIYKMPGQSTTIDSIPLNSTESDVLEEIPEVQNINSEKNVNQQQFERVRTSDQIAEDSVIDITIESFLDTSVSVDNICTECPNFSINESSKTIEPKTMKSDVLSSKLVPNSTADKIIVTEEKDKGCPQQSQREGCPQQSQKENSYDLNNIGQSNVNNINREDENVLSVHEDNNKDKSDSQNALAENYSEVNEVGEDNINKNICTNTTETCNTNEEIIGRTIITNNTKIKKKSKLQKLREKLVPSCKIKKMSPPIVKHSSKTYNIRHKDTTVSSALNQKMAYENAVKVMAEIRSNRELQDQKKRMKPVTEDTNLVTKSSKMDLFSTQTVEINMLSTRSRTRRLSKKEDDKIVSPQHERNVGDIEKSPGNRKVRKRPAETDVNSLQSDCKRILRSASISKVTNEKHSPIAPNNAGVEKLHNDFEKSSVRKRHVKNLSGLNDSLTKRTLMNVDQDHNYNLEKNNCGSQNQHIGEARSGAKFEKTKIERMKPVIELSECLSDNANVVSIIPANFELDVNKNNNSAKKSANTHLLGDQNSHPNINKQNIVTNDRVIPMEDNYIQQNHKVTNSSQDDVSKTIMKTKDGYSDKTDIILKDSRTGDRSETIKEQNNSNIHMKQHIQVLRNVNVHDISNSSGPTLQEHPKIVMKNPIVQIVPLKSNILASKNNIISYSDLDLFTMKSLVEDKVTNVPSNDGQSLKQNVLCSALDRYGVISVKYAAKRVPEAVTSKICVLIEESIAKIISTAKAEQKKKMDELIDSILHFNTKFILAGMMMYLKDKTRKNELFNKIINGSAPAMTKSEVILLYVIEKLNVYLPSSFINRLWKNMEHALFQLNRSPDFDVIESVSHFYAVLCRYFRNKSRLRCFMLDAMYCLQFKAVPLIRQCLDVCPAVLPSAHERMAKTSLVTCLVYLLHFYKCQDKFNRAQDIRNILCRRYQYRFSEWNETMILEIFRKAIMDFRGTQNDKKMLRVALIILCKRHGAKWCQLNIIQNMLLPIIEKKDVPERIKQFCVLMLGPLLKPFPADRKAHCEIVINQLLQMLKQNISPEMKEAIYSSLIFMNKHDQERVVQALLSWNPETVSPDFEEILNDYVMEKPLIAWKKLVTKQPGRCS